tara:strand:- start:287 stop:577 length:291 start_codon:yes stop_codon:yes gene_type:complete
MIETKVFLTVTEVAKRFGVSRDVVDKWIASGDLRATNVAEAAGGKKKRWRVHVQDVGEFERLRSNKPKEENPKPRRRARASSRIVQDIRNGKRSSV